MKKPLTLGGLVITVIGLVIALLLYNTGSTWLEDGSHGQAGWWLRIAGIAVLIGSVLLTIRVKSNPKPNARWPVIIAVGMCTLLVLFGILLNETASDSKPVTHQGNTLSETFNRVGLTNEGWYSADGEPTISPDEYDLLRAIAWGLIILGAVGLGALGIRELRRQQSPPPLN